MIGKTVSHYKILEELGRGGMGVVYRAEDIDLGRDVALKFLPPEVTRAAEVKERFLHEARAVASLSHPNICTIHEIGEHEGDSFIAMEYIEGPSLKERVAAGPIKLDEAIDFAIQAAEGLSAAHGKGIVHRDIKADNIMISESGRAVITDFGLAKSAGRTQLTKEGSTLGTVAYMSPEQARGHEADHRSDIWSLGVVLYEMIAGRQPFPGEYEQAVIYSIINDEQEPLTAIRTGVPVELERIVTRCLAKDPAERYQTALDLAADLRRAKSTGSTGKWQKRVEEARRRKERKGLRKVSTRWLWLMIMCVPAVAFLIIFVIVPRYFSSDVGRSGTEKMMLAVLPFENLGPPEDEYFAGGITDAITARLASIHGLGVISRQSSMQYKGSDKSIGQIGAELDVDYILEGTVQRERPGDPESLVRCIPQLINVEDDVNVWAATYDRNLSQVFEVQSEIAENVARELDIALFDSEKRQLGEKPTDNLEAYEYYLLGNAYSDRNTAADIDSAASMYRKAVELDPDFAIAWVKLSMALGSLYWAFEDTEHFTEAKNAADKAMTLAPGLPESRLAVGFLHYIQFDFEGALEEYGKVLDKHPGHSEAMQYSGLALRRLGRLDESLRYFERLEDRNPRNYELIYDHLGITNFWLRRYDDAEKYCDRAIALLPDVSLAYVGKAQVLLNRDGDINAAERVLREAMRRTYIEIEVFGWGASRSQARILPEVYKIFLDRPEVTYYSNSVSDSAFLYIAKAEVNSAMNHPDMAAAYYDSAKAVIEKNITKARNTINQTSLNLMLAFAYAGLGKDDEAVRAGKKAVELRPISVDYLYGTLLMSEMARIYTGCGEYDKAIDQLESALSMPSDISVELLRIDPAFDPLRDHPRFIELIEKYSGGGQ